MAMSYIVHRNQSFYVVAYNGLDPITGTERRRWHPPARHPRLARWRSPSRSGVALRVV